jgi:trigger factor
LKIETELLEDHQIKVVVEFEEEVLEQAKHRAARQIAKRTKIPGFRPGKAPYNIVQRHVGDEALVEEGIEILVNDQYPEILKEADIHPYGPGKLENISNLNPLILEFIIPLAADVELGDYHSVRFPYEQPVVSQQEVESVIQNLRQRMAVEEKVEHPIEEGDRVHMRLSAMRQGNDESNTTLISERDHNLVVALKSEENRNEWPFPGFSRELIGMSKGDHKTLIHTFSEDSDYETLRGVTASFEIDIEDVMSRTLPEPDDEFAQTVGEYENFTALEKDVRETLERQASQNYNNEFDEQVIATVVSQSIVKYPPQMLTDETNEVIHQMGHRLENQGLDLETYKKTRGIDDQGLYDEAQPVAENRIKRSLVLQKIAVEEKIQVSPDDLQAETGRTLEAMAGYLDKDQFRKLTSDQNYVSGLIGNIMAEMRVEKTLERLRSIAKGELDSPEEAVEDDESETKLGDNSSIEESASTELVEESVIPDDVISE